MARLPIERIQALALKPGDLLIVTLPDRASPRAVDEVKAAFDDELPDQHVIVVVSGLTIDAYRPIPPPPPNPFVRTR